MLLIYFLVNTTIWQASYEKLLKMLAYGAPRAGKSTLAKRLVAELAQRTTVSQVELL